MRSRLAAAGAIAAGWLGLASCTFVSDLGYLGDAVDGGRAVTTDGGADPPRVDGGDPADGGVDACAPGTRILPVRASAFVPELLDGEAPQAHTCDLERVLVEDDALAGLDRTVNGTVGRGRLKGEDVAGCVAVEFDQDIASAQIAVKLGRVPDACGVSPCDPDGGCNTNTGLQALIYAGPSVRELELVGNPKYGAVIETLRPRLPDIIRSVNVVLVCRHGNVSVTRDDVGVDAVWAECR
jgi:hypothetical protein